MRSGTFGVMMAQHKPKGWKDRRSSASKMALIAQEARTRVKLANKIHSDTMRIRLANRRVWKRDEFWSMSRLTMMDLDAAEACESWSDLHKVAYNADVPVAEFKEVLAAASEAGTVDDIDANNRSALILVVQVAASLSLSDSHSQRKRQIEKLQLLLEAGADIWLWDEDHETAVRTSTSTHTLL